MAVLRSVQRRGVREPEAPLAVKKKEPVRTMSPEMEAYNIDSVSATAPLALNVQPAPVIETASFVSPEPIQQQQPQTPVVDPAAQITKAGEAGNLNAELANQRTNLENEITTLQETMANTPQAQIDAKKRMGIYEDERTLQGLNEQLSTVKQDLLAATDRGTELQELGRQKISDFGGTSGDLGQLTNQDQRENSLNQLALSRTYSRLGDAAGNIQASINANVAAIAEKAQAEQAKIEFDINQRNKILDRVIQTQGNILSAEQAQRLEDTKFANTLQLESFKTDLATKKMLLETAASKGYDIASFDNLADTDISSIITRTTPPSSAADIMSDDPAVLATLTDGQWKARNDRVEAKTEQEKADAKKNMVNETNAANADGIISVISQMLDPVNSEGLKNSVGTGVLGRTDISFLGMGKDSTAFRTAATQLVSEATLKRLIELKQSGATLGALSNEERLMLERASTGMLGNHLGDGVFEANEKDFVQNLETLQMANMKLYLSAQDNDKWERSGLKAVEYDSPLVDANGSEIDGFDYISNMYKDAKFSVLNQTPVDIYNAKGELIEDAPVVEEAQISTAPDGVDVAKLIQIESGGSGNYNALNPTSGAYGKYQFMPATQTEYANKLGISEEQARTPQGQEAMFARLTQDNMAGLERIGMPVSTVSVYLAHQQGLRGARQINDGNLDADVRRNVLANLPPQYNGGMSDAEIIQGWKDVFLPQLT